MKKYVQEGRGNPLHMELLFKEAASLISNVVMFIKCITTLPVLYLTHQSNNTAYSKDDCKEGNTIEVIRGSWFRKISCVRHSIIYTAARLLTG
jgi:hypothetical protein